MRGTQLSKRRLIVSGDLIELYEYEHPYAYNVAPMRMSSGDISEPISEELNARRADNLGHVRSEIRRLIECNFRSYGYQPVFITLTFRENILDVDYANTCFKAFIRRFARLLGRPPRYLAIIEFQKRGAVHYHCVFFNVPLAFEERERRTRDISALWRMGFVDVERIRHARSVSAYVCKYLNKGLHDPRLRGRKSYLTSHALFRPREVRRESSIDRFCNAHSMSIVRVDTYQSIKRGAVKYTQFHATRNNSSV